LTRILVIGDSLTEGMAPFLGPAGDEYGLSVVGVGRVGWTTGRWVREGDVPSLLEAYRPDVVVYALGTNDDRVSETAVRALLAAAEGREVRWVGPFDSGRLDAALGSLLGSRFVSGVPLGDGIPRTPDGVHMTRDGYSMLARRLVGALASSRSAAVAGWAIALATALATLLVLAAVGGGR